MDRTEGSERFGEVEVLWRASATAQVFSVRAEYRGEEFLNARLSATRPILPFSLDAEQTGETIFEGEFRFVGDEGGAELFFDLRYPDGETIDARLYPPSPPPPPHPPAPEPGPESLFPEVEPAGFGTLFPYLFVRPWPAVPARDLENRFVAFAAPDCAAVENDLYCALAALRAAEDRAAMEQLAVAFLDGEPPWAGQLLPSVEALRGPIRAFAELDRRVQRSPGLDLDGFRLEAEEATGEAWAAIASFVLAPESPFTAELARVWRSYFALLITLGDDVPLLESLTETLAMSDLVERIARSEVPSDGPPLGEAWTPERIQAGARATPLLPAAVFPLPPSKPPAGSAGEEAPSIRPYAVGDLLLVEQRLTGYRLGEVSAIENVLRGELKETTRRRLARRTEEDEVANDESTGLDSERRGLKADLAAAATEILDGQFKYSYLTTYGPPTKATAQGDLTLEKPDPEKPLATRTHDATRFARDVVERSAQRVTRQISQRRRRGLLQEDEETVVHRFDGTRADANVRGIYRWVDKRYRMRVVRYGRRLLLELQVPDPASRFIADQERLTGETFSRPLPPEEIGLTDPTKVSTDPASPLYWAVLAARYRALDVAPPPPATTTAAAALEGGGTKLGTLVPLPGGYRASAATVRVGWRAGLSTKIDLSGLVGVQPFSASSDLEPTPIRLELAGESLAVPVSLTATDGAGADPPGFEPPFVLNVEIEATLETGALERWQLETYRALIAGFEERSTRYYRSSGATPDDAPARNPLWYRETERRALARDVVRQLLDQARTLLGDAEAESAEVASAPRYLQFLERAFEWRQMTYSLSLLTEGPEGHRRVLRQFGDADELFTAFLEASSARVVLPVDPALDFSVVYFLATGLLWPAADRLAPANPDSVALLDDLKTLDETPSASEPEESWEVVVPSELVVLQDGPDLPELGSAAEARGGTT